MDQTTKTTIQVKILSPVTRSLAASSLGTSAQDTFSLIFWCLWLCRITICFDLGGQISNWIFLSIVWFWIREMSEIHLYFLQHGFLKRLHIYGHCIMHILGLGKFGLYKTVFVILRTLSEIFYRRFKSLFRNCFRDLFQLQLLLSTQKNSSLRSQFAIS